MCPTKTRHSAPAGITALRSCARTARAAAVVALSGRCVSYHNTSLRPGWNYGFTHACLSLCPHPRTQHRCLHAREHHGDCLRPLLKLVMTKVFGRSLLQQQAEAEDKEKAATDVSRPTMRRMCVCACVRVRESVCVCTRVSITCAPASVCATNRCAPSCGSRLDCTRATLIRGSRPREHPASTTPPCLCSDHVLAPFPPPPPSKVEGGGVRFVNCWRGR